MQPAEIKIDIVKNEIFKNWLNYKIGVLLVTSVMYLYLGWSLLMISQYKEKVPHIFSNIDLYELKWIKVLFVSAFILYSGFVTLNFLDLIFRFVSFNDFQFFSFLFGSIFILVLGFYGHQQSNIFSSNYSVSKSTTDILSHEAYENLTDERTKEFIRRLLSFMETKKPFLDPTINIEILSNKLSVSTFYLSDILNNQMNINFLDFINSYRIEEFKTIVSYPENENIKIAALANEVGFNSKATFNRVFKKKTKITPSEFIQINIDSFHQN
jgi:AraC-like DNA-binding protein